MRLVCASRPLRVAVASLSGRRDREGRDDLPSWSCSLCDAQGTAWTPRLAYQALVIHYADAHADPEPLTPAPPAA